MTIAGVILAAGRSTRFGAENKLLARLDGVPLVRIIAAKAVSAGLDPVIVVTGHEVADVQRALEGIPANLVHNPHYATGMASSLRAGIEAVPAGAKSCLVMLGDMPRIRPATLRDLQDAYHETPDAAAIIPAHAGEWGNPVLIARRLFADVAALAGDQGARRLFAGRADIRVLDCDDPGILADIDTPEALAALAGRPAKERQ